MRGQHTEVCHVVDILPVTLWRYGRRENGFALGIVGRNVALVVWKAIWEKFLRGHNAFPMLGRLKSEEWWLARDVNSRVGR